MGRFRMTAAGFALVLVAGFAIGEAWRPIPPTQILPEVVLASSLRAFEDCGEFLDTVRSEALQTVGPYGLNGGTGYFGGDAEIAVGGVTRLESSAGDSGGGVVGMGGGSSGSSSGAPQIVEQLAPAQADGGGSFDAGDSGNKAFAPPAPSVDVVEVSGTNVQERGVDEPDLLKSNGRVLASIARGRLQLVDLRSGAPSLASSLELTQGWGHELLLHGDRLLITANVHEDPRAANDSATSSRMANDLAMFNPGTPRIELKLLDVADPANPKTLGTVKLDGQLVSSRLVDGMVRVVMRSNPSPAMSAPRPGPATDHREMQKLEAQAMERNTEIVKQSAASDWLPQYTLVAPDGDTVDQAPVVECTAVRAPEQLQSFGLLSVLAIAMTGDDAGTLTPTGSASVLGDGDIVYATPDRLYLAINRYEETVQPGAEPVDPDTPVQNKPMRVEDGDAMIVNPAPAPDRQWTPPRTFADIHEFDTSNPRQPVYTASGSVPGHLLGQWALSAHNGYLRVASTDGQFGGPQTSESAVYVLQRQGDKLKEVGRVGGLGKDERIYAVRYFGDYGFVVTFRQTDPLYALDLADPTKPRVLGELKVPGYSAYLHPVGEGLLLGVGQDADEQSGQRKGVQVSLFDVADLNNPRRVGNVTFGPNSSTPVEHDHRAFLWWPSARRAILPLQQSNWSESEQRDIGFFGAVAVDVNGGVSQSGRLSHNRGDNVDPWWGQINRAMVVGDTLFTVSERGLMASGINDLAERGWLEFGGPNPMDGGHPTLEEVVAAPEPAN